VPSWASRDRQRPAMPASSAARAFASARSSSGPGAVQVAGLVTGDQPVGQVEAGLRPLGTVLVVLVQENSAGWSRTYRSKAASSGWASCSADRRWSSTSSRRWYWSLSPSRARCLARCYWGRWGLPNTVVVASVSRAAWSLSPSGRAPWGFGGERAGRVGEESVQAAEVGLRPQPVQRVRGSLARGGLLHARVWLGGCLQPVPHRLQDGPVEVRAVVVQVGDGPPLNPEVHGVNVHITAGLAAGHAVRCSMACQSLACNRSSRGTMSSTAP
jgi:hypothetical protein